MSVPKEFQLRGIRSDNHKKTCKVCNRVYAEHTGILCAVCMCPAEHHDAESFEECKEGRRRMARARYLADVPLDDTDKLCLQDG